MCLTPASRAPFNICSGICSIMRCIQLWGSKCPFSLVRVGIISESYCVANRAIYTLQCTVCVRCTCSSNVPSYSTTVLQSCLHWACECGSSPSPRTIKDAEALSRRSLELFPCCTASQTTVPDTFKLTSSKL